MSNPWMLSDLLGLNAGDSGRSLTLEMPTGLLLDRARCRMIQMLIEKASQGSWEVLPATSASVASVPPSPGVYMFVWHPTLTFCRSDPHADQTLRFILYVGKTGGSTSKATLKSRFKDYRQYFGSSPESLWSGAALTNRRSRLRCFLSLEPLEYWFLACNSTSHIDEIEARLQSVLNPPINKKREPILRVGSSRSAF